MHRPLAGLAAAALLGLATLLAAAGTAQAEPQAPAPIPPPCDLFALRSLRAACETVFLGVAVTVGLVNCLLNTAPVNWLRDCTTGSIGPIPIVDYLLCYYNTPPNSWASTCV
ncbi:MAG: hypothetical protein LC620_01180 [Halobacteriales archaeon]|nr:hypothetical protein [Halobacteriales archaeon]